MIFTTNKITLEDFKKKMEKRYKLLIISLIISIIGLLLYFGLYAKDIITIEDGHKAAFISGIFTGIIVALIATIITYKVILKDEKRVYNYWISYTDEREIEKRKKLYGICFYIDYMGILFLFVLVQWGLESIIKPIITSLCIINILMLIIPPIIMKKKDEKDRD